MPRLRYEEDFIQQLKYYAFSHPGMVKDTDDLQIMPDLPDLTRAYCRIRRSIEDKDPEIAQRQGFDQLLQLAFEDKIDSKHKVMYVLIVRFG